MAISHDCDMAKSHYARVMSEEGKPTVQAGDKYIVRFPGGMREKIAESAKANNRSINAEITSRLEASFQSAANAEGAQRLLGGSMALLSTMANYVAIKLGPNARGVPAAMDDAMMRIADSVKTLKPGDNPMETANQPFLDYVNALTDAVNQATEMRGSGWGSKGRLAVPGSAAEYRTDGTLGIRGDAEAIKTFLKENGVTKFIPMRDGICVGLTDAGKAAELFGVAPKTEIAKS
jgi:hypothetical protein